MKVAYCTAADVKLIIETSLSDEDIGSLIALADDDLDEMSAGVTLSATDKKKCSIYLTAIKIAERQPTSYSVGSTRISHGDRSKEWEKKVWDIINQNKTPVVKSSEYQKIDEDLRYHE